MSEWWNGLSLSLQVFHGIGILASVILVVQLILTMVGADADGRPGPRRRRRSRRHATRPRAWASCPPAP